jgi:hypothetical protein
LIDTLQFSVISSHFESGSALGGDVQLVILLALQWIRLNSTYVGWLAFPSHDVRAVATSAVLKSRLCDDGSPDELEITPKETD